MADLSSGFPSNLAFKLKQLSSFTKSIVRCIPDRASVNMGEQTRIKLPSQGLIDFRTLTIYANASCTGGNGYYYHFPRYWSSLIRQLTITANGVQLANINEYGLLYNTLHDLEASSIDQSSKRSLERYDPSICYKPDTPNANNTAIIAKRNTGWVDEGNAANDTDEKLCINNFVGILGSLSTPCLDLNLTGDVYLDIYWNNSSVLFGSAANGALPNPYANASWNLKDIRLTCSRINFGNSDYYSLIADKLTAEEPLLIGFYDYFFARGSTLQKSNQVAMNFNLNTNSLDQCIFTLQHGDYATINPLILPTGNKTTAGSVDNKTFIEVLSSPIDNSGAAEENTIHDVAFNNSYYFKRPGNNIDKAQWTINSVNVSPYPRELIEIFNEVLTAIGNVSDDKTVSGLHAGITNIYAFAKCYFTDILSLENISGDGEFWRSGLDSKSSTINIQYQASFDTQCTQTISPIIYCRSTKILSINQGRLLSVY
jgi:hypothetical protein